MISNFRHLNHIYFSISKWYLINVINKIWYFSMKIWYFKISFFCVGSKSKYTRKAKVTNIDDWAPWCLLYHITFLKSVITPCDNLLRMRSFRNANQNCPVRAFLFLFTTLHHRAVNDRNCTKTVLNAENRTYRVAAGISCRWVCRIDSPSCQRTISGQFENKVNFGY